MRLKPRGQSSALAGLCGTLLLCVPTPARAQDEWWGRDKALHLGVSGALAGGSYALSALALESRWHRAAVGAGVALGAGVAKEVYDELDYGGASYKDFVFDVAGVAVGVVAALLIDVALEDDDSKAVTASGGSLLIQF